MKENSIEKDEKILNNIKAYMQENIDIGYHKFIYNDLGYEEKCIDAINAIEHILSDYKRVLKENEELKQDRNNNYQMIALAQNEALGYIQGYEDGKKLRRSAVANIVENQQYYILKKQIEHYKEYIEKLQKENEELKNNTRKNENELEFDIDCDWIALQKILDESERSNEYISYKNEKWIKEKYCVPIQKIKDKIEGIQEEGYWLFTTDRDSDKCVEVLQELLEK